MAISGSKNNVVLRKNFSLVAGFSLKCFRRFGSSEIVESHAIINCRPLSDKNISQLFSFSITYAEITFAGKK
ncbi:MAG: hypothetical protein ACD_7C00479G0001 [uncultured bacterium]|nr:MAG: hypothetical protein ACD_7C00479G0001 [uncultured bacterium]